MGNLKNALTAVNLEIVETAIDFIPDPALRSQLKIITLAVKAPYIFLKELLPAETDQFINEVLDLEKISHEIVFSAEFQQALGKTLDNMIYESETEVREIIKKIFKAAYISQDEYAKKHFSKLQNTAKQISLPALQHLVFIRQEILPIRDRVITTLARTEQPPVGYTKEEHYASKIRNTPISKFYDEWHQNNDQEVQKNFNRNPNAKTREAYDLSAAKERKTRQEFVEFWTEYNSLGIFRQGNDPSITTIGGGSGTNQYLTEFGEKFINYIFSVSKL